MGKALLSHGDTAKTVVELSKSFEINASLSNRQGVGIVTPVLARALVRLGRRDEALAYCRRALEIAPQKRRLRQLRDELASAPPTVSGIVKRILPHQRGYR